MYAALHKLQFQYPTHYVNAIVDYYYFNSLTAKLFNLNFHPLEVVSR